MTWYHMSKTLLPGEEMKNDYEKKANLTLPFIRALEKGIDCYSALVTASEKKKLSLPSPLSQMDSTEFYKWAVEGAFEWIRKTEFPAYPSRIKCKFFFDTPENFRLLYSAGWEQEPEEERSKIHLFEIETDEVYPAKFDMTIFDKAYDVMFENQNIGLVLSYARKYFSSSAGEEPVWEYMSEKPARATKDLSDLLQHIKE